jgi:hypothetical protein
VEATKVAVAVVEDTMEAAEVVEAMMEAAEVEVLMEAAEVEALMEAAAVAGDSMVAVAVVVGRKQGCPAEIGTWVSVVPLLECVLQDHLA